MTDPHIIAAAITAAGAGIGAAVRRASRSRAKALDRNTDALLDSAHALGEQAALTDRDRLGRLDAVTARLERVAATFESERAQPLATGPTRPES